MFEIDDLQPPKSHRRKFARQRKLAWRLSATGHSLIIGVTLYYLAPMWLTSWEPAPPERQIVVTYAEPRETKADAKPDEPPPLKIVKPDRVTTNMVDERLQKEIEKAKKLDPKKQLQKLDRSLGDSMMKILK